MNSNERLEYIDANFNLLNEVVTWNGESLLIGRYNSPDEVNSSNVRVVGCVRDEIDVVSLCMYALDDNFTGHLEIKFPSGDVIPVGNGAFRNYVAEQEGTENGNS